MPCRTRFVMCGVAIALILISGKAFSFHSGGVGECSGCHSMHSASASGSFLLQNSDQSSTCLSCHLDANAAGPDSFHVATTDASMPEGTAPLQRTPGGDFGWLKKNYSYVIDGASTNEDGASHGHNIIAVDFGFVSDSVNNTAPGGSFPALQFACTSCHDPHGTYRRLSDNSVTRTGSPIIGSGSYNSSPAPASGEAVGVYRLLAGSGYTEGGVTFNGVPVAVAPETFNRSEAVTQTRVAYGRATGNGHQTWTQWCGTCHPDMQSHGHPSDDVLGSEIANTYAQYKMSGDMTGTFQSSYLSLVPFIESITDYGLLAAHAKNDDTVLDGPANSDRVGCLSCHRAHATGWEYMMRWNSKSELIVYDSLWPGTDSTPGLPELARGRTSAETRAAYYDRPATVFASYQRSLCNKCHAND